MLVVGVHAAIWRSTVADEAREGIAMVRVAREGPASTSCEDLASQAADLSDELPPCCRAHTDASQSESLIGGVQ
jgi:hypothetical protein